MEKRMKGGQKINRNNLYLAIGFHKTKDGERSHLIKDYKIFSIFAFCV